MVLVISMLIQWKLYSVPGEGVQFSSLFIEKIRNIVRTHVGVLYFTYYTK